jgi:vacuolar-type H+-ATPase subunit E/Vma4
MTDSQQPDEPGLPESFRPLLDHLRAEGDATRKAIRARTEETTEMIKNEAKAEKLKALEDGQSELDGLADGIRRKAADQANRERRDRIRREVGLAVDRILATCQDRARDQRDTPDFATRLGQFLHEAMCCAKSYQKRLGDSQLTVVVHPTLADTCRQLLVEQNLTATVTESESAETGVLVLLDGTPYRIINTVESRLLKNDEEIRSLISKRLTAALEEKHGE